MQIVHFDLKSPNILLARDYTAKIADVGLAKILQADFLSTLKEVHPNPSQILSLQVSASWSAIEALTANPCTWLVDCHNQVV